jgi:hypothetical protein
MVVLEDFVTQEQTKTSSLACSCELITNSVKFFKNISLTNGRVKMILLSTSDEAS